MQTERNELLLIRSELEAELASVRASNEVPRPTSAAAAAAAAGAYRCAGRAQALNRKQNEGDRYGNNRFDCTERPISHRRRAQPRSSSSSSSSDGCMQELYGDDGVQVQEELASLRRTLHDRVAELRERDQRLSSTLQQLQGESQQRGELQHNCTQLSDAQRQLTQQNQQLQVPATHPFLCLPTESLMVAMECGRS